MPSAQAAGSDSACESGPGGGKPWRGDTAELCPLEGLLKLGPKALIVIVELLKLSRLCWL